MTSATAALPFVPPGTTRPIDDCVCEVASEESRMKLNIDRKSFAVCEVFSLLPQIALQFHNPNPLFAPECLQSMACDRENCGSPAATGGDGDQGDNCLRQSTEPSVQIGCGFPRKRGAEQRKRSICPFPLWCPPLVLKPRFYTLPLCPSFERFPFVLLGSG